MDFTKQNQQTALLYGLLIEIMVTRTGIEPMIPP